MDYCIYHYVLPALLISISSLMYSARAASELIDNFSLAGLNNIGGVRGGHYTQIGLTYPRQGIYVPDKDSYLLETLVPANSYINLVQKSLKIQYTSPSQNDCKVMFMQFDRDLIDSFKISASIHVTVKAGLNIVVIPMSMFERADLSQGHGFGIAGPLVVHRLELLDTADPVHFDELVTQVRQVDEPSLEQIVTYPIRRDQLLNPYFQDPKDYQYSSKNVHARFIERIHVQGDSSVESFNAIKLRRFGSRISRTSGGIHIAEGGHLYEYLSQKSGEIDLSGKRVRIKYSSDTSTEVVIKFQYHQGTHSASEDGFTIPLNFPDGQHKTFDVRISRYTKLKTRDCQLMWIFGSLTIHRIELVTRVNRNRFIDLFIEPPENVDLVDNFASWPETIEHINAEDTWHAPIGINPSFYNPGNGLNNLYLPCGGSGASVGFPGVCLSHKGYVYEQLAPQRGAFDLNGVILVFKYSASREVSRQLEITTVIPRVSDGAFDLQTVKIDLHFLTAHDALISVPVGRYGLARAIRITGLGELCIHHIHISIPSSFHPRSVVKRMVIDDFKDWPLSNTDSSNSDPGLMSDPNQYGLVEQARSSMTFYYGDSRSSNCNLFDYRNTVSQCPPVLRECTYLMDQGIEISESGVLTQSLESTIGSSIKIKYSSKNQVSRKIVFVTDSVSYFRGISEEPEFIKFSPGQNNEIVIPLPYIDIDILSVIGIRIHGRLIVHSMELLQSESSTALVRHQKKEGEPILVDDFSSWSNLNLNNLGRGRDSLGTIGIEYIALNRPEDYLVEHFVGTLGSKQLDQFMMQITYTTRHDVTCRMSLILTRWNEPSITGLSEVSWDHVFITGTNTQLTIPFKSAFDATHPSPHVNRFFGIRINGPPADGSQLIIHRIELLTSRPVLKTETPLSPFQIQLRKIQKMGTLKIHVRRGHIWKDAFKEVTSVPASELQKRLKIVFVGEWGEDSRGLSREFFSLLANEINDPRHNLFMTLESANYALQINPDSRINGRNHLQYYQFVGRLIGLAILNEHLLGIRFVPSLYRKLLSKPVHKDPRDESVPDLLENDDREVDISELEALDSDKYSSFTWILENDISVLPDKMTMTMERKRIVKSIFPWRKNSVLINLVKNGHKHFVTNNNKRQYVGEYTKWLVHKLVQEQADKLRLGIYDVIPESLISSYSVTELELLIGGTYEIDLDDWKENTVFQSDHPQRDLFWKCVESWDNEKRLKLIQFVTGSSRIPSNGFAGLDPKFTVSKFSTTLDDSSNVEATEIPDEPGVPGGTELSDGTRKSGDPELRRPDVPRLPTASTCNNQIYLPVYDNFEILCEKLDFVTGEEATGFGFM